MLLLETERLELSLLEGDGEAERDLLEDGLLEAVFDAVFDLEVGGEAVRVFDVVRVCERLREEDGD